MIKTTTGSLTLIKSEKIESHHKVSHFFSTRERGVSHGIFSSLNFGTHHGEAENMMHNLEILKNSLGVSNTHFVIPKQTHSDTIAVVEESNRNHTFESTDALITQLPDVVICVKTADCVPILLFDPQKNVVGAVHSGWRGTAQNIVGKTIRKMTSTFGCNPADVIAVIGPCIGQPNYEVGNEVVEAISPLLAKPPKAFVKSTSNEDKLRLDLTEANFQLLIQEGVDERSIDAIGLCTFNLNHLFYSARRDGAKTGRMINGIGLRNS